MALYTIIIIMVKMKVNGNPPVMFCGTLLYMTQSGLKAVLQLLDWVWQNLSRGDDTIHVQSLSFIAKASLDLLKTYIRSTTAYNPSVHIEQSIIHMYHTVYLAILHLDR